MAPQFHAPRGGRRLTLALAAACLTTAAYAQDSAPPHARPSPLVEPGVGGCIYARVDAGARKAAIRQTEAGAELPAALSAEIQRVAPACSQLPLTPTNRPLWAAAISVFVRNGLAARITAAHGPSQKEADDAWRAAAPDDQQPFLAAARTYLETGRAQVPETSALEPFRAHLKRASPFPPEAARALSAYLYETAVAEVAETQLAGQTPKTPS